MSAFMFTNLLKIDDCIFFLPQGLQVSFSKSSNPVATRGIKSQMQEASIKHFNQDKKT